MSPNEFDEHVARLFIKPADSVGRMCHAAMGAASEAGELITPVKAHWIYGKPLDTENILEESGDAIFYISALLQECGFTLEDAMRHNVAKLAKRYPSGYSDANAIQRKDKQ